MLLPLFSAIAKETEMPQKLACLRLQYSTTTCLGLKPAVGIKLRRHRSYYTVSWSVLRGCLLWSLDLGRYGGRLSTPATFPAIHTNSSCFWTHFPLIFFPISDSVISTLQIKIFLSRTKRGHDLIARDQNRVWITLILNTIRECFNSKAIVHKTNFQTMTRFVQKIEKGVK